MSFPFGRTEIRHWSGRPCRFQEEKLLINFDLLLVYYWKITANNYDSLRLENGPYMLLEFGFKNRNLRFKRIILFNCVDFTLMSLIVIRDWYNDLVDAWKIEICNLISCTACNMSVAIIIDKHIHSNKSNCSIILFYCLITYINSKRRAGD